MDRLCKTESKLLLFGDSHRYLGEDVTPKTELIDLSDDMIDALIWWHENRRRKDFDRDIAAVVLSPRHFTALSALIVLHFVTFK